MYIPNHTNTLVAVSLTIKISMDSNNKKKSKAHHERDTCTQINEKMRSTMHALTAYCLQWNYINISGACVYMYVEIYI